MPNKRPTTKKKGKVKNPFKKDVKSSSGLVDPLRKLLDLKPKK